ncbi:hypothetical protein IM538_09315 [Cytobacillus suaedae]|nr:hypothetical protein IM538_09315 [Cytobacillus suaedae]
MFSLRGDAHKFYLRLIKTLKNGESFSSIKGLAEIEEIQQHYQSINSETLKLIYYRMIKEKNGTGIVPIFVTAVPWFLFLFSKQLQEFLFKEGSTLWIIFGIIYFSTLSVSVVVHFREKAWAAFHIEIIQDILKERNETLSSNT